ncbi:thioredoxin family protein [Dissulfurirhabdus thermomarina]|uniref:Thioredoxin family protein n=1 Tax=Dissulfurirhabdus thermomarina TaxID=1765737 RepID=A0A6N9TUG5_DISTH|nr:thioredoxin family protein [Dissulfurirhabdus thermomarina]NDY43374.1 thioredoxin family protein [Dissulfurirhabdus thermomarina]NMX23805.1 thioredoxin family protein [Dissulfurirhabdus thermomarina]
MKIEILGPGCARCEALRANAEQAVKELGLEAEIEKVSEMGRIIGYGVLTTPGIVVDGKVKGYGKLFSVEEIKRLLTGEEG